METFIKKKNYQPPRIITVSMMVESGYSGSDGVQSVALPALDNWNTANNSGERFWGGTGGAGGTTEPYSSPTSGWSW